MGVGKGKGKIATVARRAWFFLLLTRTSVILEKWSMSLDHDQQVATAIRALGGANNVKETKKSIIQGVFLLFLPKK